MRKAYRVYNKITKKVMETINVIIDEASEFGSRKISEEISLKKFFLPSPRMFKNLLIKGSHLQVLLPF